MTSASEEFCGCTFRKELPPRLAPTLRGVSEEKARSRSEERGRDSPHDGRTNGHMPDPQVGPLPHYGAIASSMLGELKPQLEDSIMRIVSVAEGRLARVAEAASKANAVGAGPSTADPAAIAAAVEARMVPRLEELHRQIKQATDAIAGSGAEAARSRVPPLSLGSAPPPLAQDTNAIAAAVEAALAPKLEVLNMLRQQPSPRVIQAMGDRAEDTSSSKGPSRWRSGAGREGTAQLSPRTEEELAQGAIRTSQKVTFSQEQQELSAREDSEDAWRAGHVQPGSPQSPKKVPARSGSMGSMGSAPRADTAFFAVPASEGAPFKKGLVVNFRRLHDWQEHFSVIHDMIHSTAIAILTLFAVRTELELGYDILVLCFCLVVYAVHRARYDTMDIEDFKSLVGVLADDGQDKLDEDMTGLQNPNRWLQALTYSEGGKFRRMNSVATVLFIVIIAGVWVLVGFIWDPSMQGKGDLDVDTGFGVIKIGMPDPAIYVNLDTQHVCTTVLVGTMMLIFHIAFEFCYWRETQCVMPYTKDGTEWDPEIHGFPWQWKLLGAPCIWFTSPQAYDDLRIWVTMAATGGPSGNGTNGSQVAVRGQGRTQHVELVKKVFPEEFALYALESPESAARLRRSLRKSMLYDKSRATFLTRNSTDLSPPITVHIISARGLRNADILPGDCSDPYCCCEIISKHQSKFRTPVAKNQLNPQWKHIAEMVDYEAGDSLLFTIWDHDNYKRDDFLGSVLLEASRLEDDEFDGELPIEHAGKGISAFLRIKVCLSSEDTGSRPQIRMRGLTRGNSMHAANHKQASQFYDVNLKEGQIPEQLNMHLLFYDNRTKQLFEPFAGDENVHQDAVVVKPSSLYLPVESSADQPEKKVPTWDSVRALSCSPCTDNFEGTYANHKVTVHVARTGHWTDRSHVLQEIKHLEAVGRHPNIVNLIFSDTRHLKRPYLALEAEEPLGFDLDKLANCFKWRQAQVPSALLRDLVEDVADGLSHMHSRGVIHRNIIAENIAVTHARRSATAWLEAPSPGGASRSSSFSMPGRPGYTAKVTGLYLAAREGTRDALQASHAAPELCKGRRLLDTAVDCWGVGVILHQVYQGTAVLVDHVTGKRLKGVPSNRMPMETVTQEAMQMLLKADPDNRWTLESLRASAWFQRGPASQTLWEGIPQISMESRTHTRHFKGNMPPLMGYAIRVESTDDKLCRQTVGDLNLPNNYDAALVLIERTNGAIVKRPQDHDIIEAGDWIYLGFKRVEPVGRVRQTLAADFFPGSQSEAATLAKIVPFNMEFDCFRFPPHVQDGTIIGNSGSLSKASKGRYLDLEDKLGVLVLGLLQASNEEPEWFPMPSARVSAGDFALVLRRPLRNGATEELLKDEDLDSLMDAQQFREVYPERLADFGQR